MSEPAIAPVTAKISVEAFDSLSGETIKPPEPRGPGRPALPPDERDKRERERRQRETEQKRLRRQDQRAVTTASVPAAGIKADALVETMDLDDEDLGNPVPSDAAEGRGEAGSTASVPAGRPRFDFNPPVGEKDSAGNVFDAARHKVGPDGSPLKDDAGKFKRKNKKRTSEDEDEYDAFAGIATEATYQIAGFVFDPGEAVPTPERQEKMKEAWAVYARHKQLSIADPFYALLAQNLIYFQSVVAQPKSRAKVQGWAEKAVGWFRARFSSSP